ncbi:MAG: cob(I)yrinic acid a,c-diamide adenosyltransferase [Minisyncoccia bacterium]
MYTRKGDDGKTTLFHCDQRLSKSSIIAEALGTLDELNSFLGICRTKASGEENNDLAKQILLVQNDLFIIQASLAGADKHINLERVEWLENIIGGIEKEIPPIKNFIIPGSDEVTAHIDYARTLARKAERRAVAVFDEGKVQVEKNTLIYLNRLSSFLFALGRQKAYKSGINEEHPNY